MRSQALAVGQDSRRLAQSLNTAPERGAALPAQVAPHERGQVREAASTADALERQAALLAKAVAGLAVDDGTRPALVLAGGLEAQAITLTLAQAGKHLHLALGPTRSR